MKYLKIPALILLCALLVSLLGCEKLDLSGGKDKDGDLPVSEDASDPRTLTVKTTVTGRDTFRPDEGISPKTDAILARLLLEGIAFDDACIIFIVIRIVTHIHISILIRIIYRPDMLPKFSLSAVAGRVITPRKTALIRSAESFRIAHSLL